MVRPAQLVASPTRLVIDGETYNLADDGKTTAHEKVPVETQPGDDGTDFERRLVNIGLPWGASRFIENGTYYYGYPGIFWRRMSWLPGMAYTNLSTAMGDRVSFAEWWDGSQATRRLMVIDKTSVREIDNAGNLSVNGLTGLGLTNANGMLRATRYKPSVAVGGTEVPGRMYFSRVSGTFITRTAAATYQVSASGKAARALGAGKDSAGADVLWRSNENGRLNQCVAGADPETPGSWGTADYGTGETSSEVNDIWQQSKRLLVGREDGVFTFDANSNAGIPLTRGMEQLPDLYNFSHFKDFNGACVGPSVMGLVMIDGLEWSVIGPISATSDARDYRGREVAVSNLVGEHIYCAVYFGGSSYIWHGRAGSGNRPVDWHGIVAIVPNQQVTDLHISTTYDARLWVGHTTGYGYCILNTDLSPYPDAASGYIYLPEGILDMAGPGVIKDFRKAEFIAPAGRPFSATNSWTLALDLDGSGTYVNIDGGAVASGQVTSRFWTTETFSKRARARLQYTGNIGLAELEQVVIRGTERPEKTWEHTFRIVAEDESQFTNGTRFNASARGITEKLEALINAGRKVGIVYGDEQFTARVRDVREAMPPNPLRSAPTRNIEVVMREVLLA